MCKKTLSIIISVCKDELKIRDAIQAYKRLNPAEIIVVADAKCLLSIEIARSYECTVIIHEDLLFIHKGHAIGAKQAKGDLLFFIDGSMVISSSTLNLFLEPLKGEEADVAINNMDRIYIKKQRPSPLTVFSQITNHFFGQSELKSDSLLFIPYAMTKNTVNVISADYLANPVFAHLKIIELGLKITNHIPIVDISSFFKRAIEHSSLEQSETERQIVKYHLDAISYYLIEMGDSRAGYSDGERRLDIVKALKTGLSKNRPKITSGSGSLNGGRQLSIIIPVQNEAKLIRAVIQECQKLAPFEIIVVVNGTHDETADIARSCGAKVIEYNEKLGLDTGRAVGAFFAEGDILLFIDGDFVIPMEDLLPFVLAVQSGVDLALNDLNHFLSSHTPLHIVTASKYAINLACDRKDLGVGSTVAVPHAFSKECVEKIGFHTLATPVISQVKAIYNGCSVKNVHHVEVDKKNRFRPKKHFTNKKGELAPTTSLIVGDHIEALSYLANDCLII